MKIDVKTLFDLLLINAKNTIEFNKNKDEVTGHLECLEDLLKIPMYNDFEEIEEYRNKIKKLIKEHTAVN